MPNRFRLAADAARSVFAESVRSLQSYFKAQLGVAAIVALLYTIAFLIIGTSASLLKAVGIAALDLLPMVGSGIILTPWIVIQIVQGKVRMALALGIIYVAITVLRMVIDPLLTGRAIGIHPIVTVVCAVGATLALGPWGILVGPILAVVLSTIVRLHSVSIVQQNERAARRRRRQT